MASEDVGGGMDAELRLFQAPGSRGTGLFVDSFGRACGLGNIPANSGRRPAIRADAA